MRHRVAQINYGEMLSMLTYVLGGIMICKMVYTIAIILQQMVFGMPPTDEEAATQEEDRASNGNRLEIPTLEQ